MSNFQGKRVRLLTRDPRPAPINSNLLEGTVQRVESGTLFLSDVACLHPKLHLNALSQYISRGDGSMMHTVAYAEVAGVHIKDLLILEDSAVHSHLSQQHELPSPPPLAQAFSTPFVAMVNNNHQISKTSTGKGLKKDLIIAPPAAASKTSKKKNKNQKPDSAASNNSSLTLSKQPWQDVASTQSDFDFTANLNRFDKQSVFAEFGRAEVGNPVADRLVTINRKTPLEPVLNDTTMSTEEYYDSSASQAPYPAEIINEIETIVADNADVWKTEGTKQEVSTLTPTERDNLYAHCEKIGLSAVERSMHAARSISHAMLSSIPGGTSESILQRCRTLKNSKSENSKPFSVLALISSNYNGMIALDTCACLAQKGVTVHIYISGTSNGTIATEFGSSIKDGLIQDISSKSPKSYKSELHSSLISCSLEALKKIKFLTFAMECSLVEQNIISQTYIDVVLDAMTDSGNVISATPRNTPVASIGSIGSHFHLNDRHSFWFLLTRPGHEDLSSLEIHTMKQILTFLVDEGVPASAFKSIRSAPNGKENIQDTLEAHQESVVRFMRKMQQLSMGIDVATETVQKRTIRNNNVKETDPFGDHWCVLLKRG